ncbi:hypothetical protein SAMN04487880_1562 [Marinobacter sp. es.042]|uniref:hypothetical protein n=1 Tax=Marinobacter sp. es.042 TaxID=1761794 RepID=UPI000B4FDF7A|nr:hypothetical protein [Marinobacter sp. es.042]SNB56338.1 hypothetical protein SAMN04487880_1562 [Marinobacter sp. es.042]
MRFTWNTLKSGMVCFVFTPILMLVLVITTSTGAVTAESELPPFLMKALDWRYSADGFFLILLMSVLLSFLVVAILKTQEIPRHEQNLVGKFFNVTGAVISKVCIFWAGVFLAWSFGSHLIDFVPAIPGQTLVIPVCLALAVLSRLGFLKLKHFVIRG